MTATSSWQAARYPVTLLCPFCGRTLTIDLRDDGPTTVTTGHAHDCPNNPARTTSVRQGSAA